ncbi:MAG: hypothetical protein H7144_02805 [Burkholderiales bacterium]|nr:hypothetical protein [Phycisphaerae bacterium]
MAFINDTANDPLQPFRGSLIVALSGDRAPFATSGMKLNGPQGHMVVRVDLDTKKVEDFIFNTKRLPASKIGNPAGPMERPIDIKLGPDGALYILDYGQMDMKNGRERIKDKTGRLYRLGTPAPLTSTTRPSQRAVETLDFPGD